VHRSRGTPRRNGPLPAPSGLKWSADGKKIYVIGSTWPDTPDDAGRWRKEKEQTGAKRKVVVIDYAVFHNRDKWLYDGKRPVVYANVTETGKHANLLAGTGNYIMATRSLRQWRRPHCRPYRRSGPRSQSLVVELDDEGDAGGPEQVLAVHVAGILLAHDAFEH
jgi:hypothetical protein